MRRLLALFFMVAVLHILPSCAGVDTIAVKTIPDNAKVFKDETFMCNSPCDIPFKFSGTTGEIYNITLEKEGYKKQSYGMDRSQLFDKYFAGNYIPGSKFGSGNTFVFTYSLEKNPEPDLTAKQVSPAPVILKPAHVPATPFKQELSRRVALVIGNSAYKTSPLPNPVNDARDIAASLPSLGFEVMLVQNAGLREMEEAINSFSKKAHDAVAFFFFAGHGLQLDGENYLVPIDADMDDEGDVRYESVSAGRVMDNLRYADSNLNIVVLDACRDNPFARSFRSKTRGLARLSAPRGSIIAFSTAPGDVAADGAGRNSPYATAFIRHVANPTLSVESFFKEVAKDVSAQTRDQQRPWVSSDFLGDFSFGH
ncbi:caspase family protein [Maridesulfovibrio salexigens]|uniref:Peptidase C14 caspase catalytic subunit p20 n=1 Tax=Maridesulfovibrio salexigens (strain ATCC 14822 / DSM 2638 / NCIMB 8403 / VKM B-1763) TaxID=526222 RepID=C6BVW2_MARSD|nr:caspase family protein [Maridesulfovibrio salexigens]ACS80165.1 peptidase C14 caspase catalytic subunit p20 [Maridesulfovibrio salexigens DSM 2638]